MYVENVEKTIAFYDKAFGFKQKFTTSEKDYAELISGETTLAFASLELGKSNLKKGFISSNKQNKPFGIELAFTTKNIEKDIKLAIKAGAIQVEELKTKPWGQKVAYLKDINGFLIEICTPIN